jgi:hypothetical protein
MAESTPKEIEFHDLASKITDLLTIFSEDKRINERVYIQISNMTCIVILKVYIGLEGLLDNIKSVCRPKLWLKSRVGLRGHRPSK